MQEWLYTLADDVWDWYRTVRVDGQPGRVRYCRLGDPLEAEEKAGLGLSCLMLKTLHILGLLDRLASGHLEDWVAWIRSFQTESGETAGYFEDPALVDRWDRDAGWLDRDWATRRAETRQACAALMSVGSEPPAPVPCFDTPAEVEDHVRSLPWSTPWAAGSHASHVMAFLEINARFFDRDGRRDELLPVVFETLRDLRDARTGTWGRGRVPPGRRINGAMKILSGFEFAGEPVPDPEPLIDFALKVGDDRDACHLTDRIYVLQQCHAQTDHRTDDVREAIRHALETLRRFRRVDGAFSFYPGGTGMGYYGVQLAESRPVSDVHGTTLLTWAAAMSADILGQREKLGWKLPTT